MRPTLGGARYRDDVVIVDGNNVVGASGGQWWRDRPAAVRRLLGRLSCYATRTGDRVELVLDVDQPDLPPGDHGGVTVTYAARRWRNAADDRIRELIADLAADDVEVVTSDRALREDVVRHGAEVVGAGAFLSRLAGCGC